MALETQLGNPLRRAVPYLVLAVVSAVFLYPFVRAFSDAPDFGVFLNGADLLNHGAIPSRDFVEPQGPGSFLWLALFFRIFGTTLETARGVLLGTGVAMGLLTFYLSRKLSATGFFAALFAVAIALPLLPINSPHYDSNLFALAALALFVRDATPKTWALVLSAVLCGIATWMIQQKGCYLAAALVVSLIWLQRGKVTVFVSVFVAVALLPFAWFAAVHALPAVWFANFVWPMSTYSELNAAPYGFPAWQNLRFLLGEHAGQPSAWVFDIASAVPFLLVALLPLLLPLAAWFTGKQWFAARLLPYWLSAYALWFSELHRIDIGHLRNGVVVMAMLFLTICEASGKKVFRAAGFFFVACTAIAGMVSFRMNWLVDRPIQTRRGTVYVDADQPLLTFLETHTHAGENVFVYPYQPIYYFVERLTNPTRYSYLNYHLHSDAQFTEATRDLDRKQVRYVIVDTQLSGQNLQQMFPAYQHPENSKLIMEPYLNWHYRLASDLGRFHVLERLSSAR